MTPQAATKAVARSPQIATLIQDVDGFLNKWVRVQVPRDREVEARELLEELHQAETSPPGADEDGAAEPEPPGNA